VAHVGGEFCLRITDKSEGILQYLADKAIVPPNGGGV
jgi:hypothetical protein